MIVGQIEFLTIDDISSQFSNLDGNPSQFATLFSLDSGRNYYNILARINNTDGDEVQLSEFAILKSNDDFFIVDKGSVVNNGDDFIHNVGEEYGEFSIFTDAFGSRH